MTHSDKAALRGEPGYVWRSGQARRFGMIQQWIDLGGRILDAGCGLGNYLEPFAGFSQQTFGLELEFERVVKAKNRATGVVQGVGEYLPFLDNSFDFVFSNEVVEHVQNDQAYMQEMVRVTRPGGRLLIFCPNRWYPVEVHGIYWRGGYKFGNKLLVNYLPDPWRNKLAPHVRTYSWHKLKKLFVGLPIEIVHHSRIFGGYDNIEQRHPRLGRLLKQGLYAAEKTPLRVLGISHLVVLEKDRRR